MKRFLALIALVVALAAPALAQEQSSAGSTLGNVQITGNGNIAFVTAGNALETDLHSVGGTTISLVSSGIPVYVENGSSGGTSLADEAAFTEGTTSGTPAECYFKTSPTALTTGQAGAVSCTAARALFVDNHSWAGTALGAPSNYGTSPGAVEVLGVNAYITNSPVLGAGTAVIGKTVPVTACGTTNYTAAWQALTTSATAITSTTTCVAAITACNTSSSTAYTFTVTDNSGTPVNVIDATSIPPASCYNWPFNYEEFTSGIKWSASNTAVTGAIQGVQ